MNRWTDVGGSFETFKNEINLRLRMAFGTIDTTALDTHKVDAAAHGVDTLAADINTVETGLSTLNTGLSTLNTGVNNHIADYVRNPGYGIATGTANIYSLTLSPVPTSYISGMCVAVNINVTNTGSSSLNINSLGAKVLKKSDGTTFAAGDLVASGIYTFRYNGTDFILQGDKVVVYGTSFISSIQRGSLSLPYSVETITISEVDTTRAIPTVSFSPTYTTDNPQTLFVSCDLNNSTALKVYRLDDDDNVIVNWTVTEYNNVKSLQSGSYSMTTLTAGIIVSAVNMNKSMLFVDWSASSSTNASHNYMISYSLSSATTISFNKIIANETTIRWKLIEFN